jgi:hypothetical protein
METVKDILTQSGKDYITDFEREYYGTKEVIIEQSYINNIEKARLNLHKLTDNIEKGTINPKDIHFWIYNITLPLYYITHRRYKETFGSKIRRLFRIIKK